MKKYLHIIVLVATAILLFACQKNASTDIVPAKQFTIVRSDLALSPLAVAVPSRCRPWKAVTAA